jgi:hypothetical protein
MIRWRRGVFRLWLVLSVVWIAFVAFVTWDDARNRAWDYRREAYPVLADVNFAFGVTFGLIPPLLAGALGIAAAWIVQGFGK